MMYKKILFSKSEHIGRVSLNNPKTLNGLDVEMATELSDALHICEEDDDIRVIILSGEGRAFCGGGDISKFVEDVSKPDFTMIPLIQAMSALTLQIKRCPKPVICAVQSAAAGGGCNLALACDVIIAAENAKFLQAFVNIGLVPDTGGGYWLPRIVGTARAFEMFATGRAVKADEALALGMITKVCKTDELMNETMVYAVKFAEGPSMAYAGIKKMLFESAYADFEKFAPLEAVLQESCGKSNDFIEGITAFVEKRKPIFKGI